MSSFIVLLGAASLHPQHSPSFLQGLFQKWLSNKSTYSCFFFFSLDSRAFLCLLTEAFVGKTVILSDLCPYFQLPGPLYLATLGWYSAILIHICYVIYNVHISFKDIFSLHKTLCAIPILQMRSLRFMEVKYTELYFYRKMELVLKPKLLTPGQVFFLTYHSCLLVPCLPMLSLQSRFLYSPPPILALLLRNLTPGTNWDFTTQGEDGRVQRSIRLETKGLSFCPMCLLLSPSRPPWT